MLIYKIKIDAKGNFIERKNRFTVEAKINKNENILAHLHDSGRLKELLFDNNILLLRKAENTEKRKTSWDIISAQADDGEYILINSSFHRHITDKLFLEETISPFGKVDDIKAEVKYGNSRLDYLITKGNEKIYVETKGVSLSNKGIATFPDAPSIRATKHLNELIEIKKSGNRAAVVLIILRNSHSFIPKKDTDPVFFETFYNAIDNGVEVYPIQFELNEKGEIYFINKKIKILEKVKNL